MKKYGSCCGSADVAMQRPYNGIQNKGYSTMMSFLLSLYLYSHLLLFNS
ncbi:hypothetical protein IC221_03105 [Flammeovirga sp. EKP202]|nr:hypothetical protein [Flammeovirga sp. EKP202]